MRLNVEDTCRLHLDVVPWLDGKETHPACDADTTAGTVTTYATENGRIIIDPTTRRAKTIKLHGKVEFRSKDGSQILIGLDINNKPIWKPVTP